MVQKSKNQGWRFYCSLKEVTYVDLVREFYLNLHYGNGTVTSTIKGIDICLDPIILGEILHLPCEGYSYMELPVKEEGINVILGRTYSGSLNKLEAKILSIEMRILHQLVTKLFFPRSGRHDLLSEIGFPLLSDFFFQSPCGFPPPQDREVLTLEDMPQARALGDQDKTQSDLSLLPSPSLPTRKLQRLPSCGL